MIWLKQSQARGQSFRKSWSAQLALQTIARNGKSAVLVVKTQMQFALPQIWGVGQPSTHSSDFCVEWLNVRQQTTSLHSMVLSF